MFGRGLGDKTVVACVESVMQGGGVVESAMRGATLGTGLAKGAGLARRGATSYRHAVLEIDSSSVNT